MALSIGELAGYLTLDDSQFEKGLDGSKKKFEGTGSWLKENGKKIGLAAGAALGAAVAAGVAANINIGAANDKLSAQLGLSAKESGRVGKVAGDLYRNAYGDSIEGVNEAVGAVMSSIKGMSNASAKDLEGVTAKALDFATAFEIDVTRASQVAGQMITTGLAKDAAEAFDLITAASQKVPAALREDLLDAGDEYGQFFAGLGYDGQQAMAMLVDASEKGMYGIDKTGDAVKEFTIRSTDMSKASGEAYKTIGLDMGDMANAILAGGDKAQGATQKIIDGILGIKDPARQAEAAIALFGTPIEDLNAQEIPKFLTSMKGMSGSMDDSAGAADRMGDTLNDNFKTKMTEWKRSAEGFIQDGIMAMVPALEKGAEKAKDFGRWVGENEKPIKIVAGIIATLLVPHYILMGIEATKAAAKTVKAWLVQQGAAIKTVAKHVWAAGVVVAKWAWMGVMAMRHALKIAAAWLISMGPIGLIIAAVAGLTLVVIKNWDKIKKIIGDGWAWVKSKSVDTWRAVRSAVSGAWDSVKEKTRSATLWIADKVLWMAEKMLGAMATAFSWVPGLGDKMKSAHEAIKGFREDVNAEMDKISNEDVKISLRTQAIGKLSPKDFAMQFGGEGGAGKSHGGHGGGHGGPGLTPHVSAPRSEVRSAAGVVSSQARLAATLQAREISKHLARNYTLGTKGKVLPRGAYSVGMPYLGYPGHYGADYPAPTGTPVYAVAAGIVSRALSLTSSYGKHAFLEHAGGRQTRYAHLSSLLVRAGESVRAGQRIGSVGSTGNSTGPHLHYEDRVNGSPRNPANLGIFDTGGLARGAGLMVKGPKPERVLSPYQTEFFEKAMAAAVARPNGERPIQIENNFPTTASPEAAYEAAGGRILAALTAAGV